MSNSTGPLIVLVAVVGGAYAGYNRKLPPQIQATWDKYIGGGMSPGPSGSGVPTSADIATWSSGIGLPTWIGTLFVADKGQLPSSIDELNAWGVAKGVRTSAGSWVAPAGVS